MSDAYELGTAELFEQFATPYNKLQTAEQTVQFYHDPSKNLNRRRYGFYSNNTLFDNAFYTNSPDGLIDISTTATGTDTARTRSSVAGQYVGHTIATPGVGIDIDSANVSYDADGYVQLSHGQIAVGAGWHDGSAGGWGVGGPVQTFIGRVYSSTGVDAVCISNGQHVFGSPVSQENWNIDDLSGQDDADNPSGVQLRPDEGSIGNWPYSWYGFGALFDTEVAAETDGTIYTHKFTPDGATLDRPNLAPMVIVDNDGTASSLSVEMGGMQYTSTGVDLKGGEGGENRGTEVTRLTGANANGFIADQVGVTNESIDPNAEPGKPAMAIQRASPRRDLPLRIEQITAQPDTSIYILAWDEYEPGTALDGTFRDPNKPISATESEIQVNTTCTTYTPTTAVMRGWDKVPGGNQEDLVPVATRDEIPIDATRVYSLVHDGSAGDAEITLRAIEGY